MEGHIFWILRYLITNQTSSQVHFNLVLWASKLCNLRIYRKHRLKIFFINLGKYHLPLLKEETTLRNRPINKMKNNIINTVCSSPL